MTLLSPWALLGLALLAIPILVHLFQPRHVRQTPFSSLRWLHLTQQRMARRIQWHQVILFLLRAAFLSLLVFALARPIWSTRGLASGLDRIIILDVSRSMGRRVEGRPTPFETARKLAVDLVRRQVAGDRVAILLTGYSTNVLTAWTSDPALHLSALESLEPTLQETRLDSALDPIRSLLAERRPDVAVEVVFLTDNPTLGWNTTEIAAFTREVDEITAVDYRLIDVSIPSPRNCWLVDARRHRAGSDNILRIDLEGVGDVPSNRVLRITGLKGVEPQEIPVTITPGRRTQLEFPLPSTFDPVGSLATLKLEPADDLADDDVLYVNLSETGSATMLLIAPIAPTDALHRPGLALETAIRALAEVGSPTAEGTLQLEDPATLTAEDVASADVILMADVPGLPESLSSAINTRVADGAGLIMFLGPTVEYENYNRRFRQPLDPSQSLLPADLAGTSSADLTEGELSRWTRWNEQNAILNGLVDPEIGDLAATSSQRWYRFDQEIPPTDDVLATLGDGTPAIIARRVGAGRVAIVNASADDRWCDLPRRKSFVPLVDRLLGHVRSAGYRRQWTIGEPIELAMPEGVADDSVPRVLSPTGKELTTQTRLVGARTWLSIDGVAESGFYRVESSSADVPEFSLVVQPGREDSRLEPSDSENFHAWWSPLDIAWDHPQSLGEPTINTGDDRIVLTPWLIALACACLLAEMFLVHWLCPEMNPAISVSHHRRRGFVAPLKERQAEREGATAS